MRRLVHLFLLLCLPLYGFAMQGGLPPAAGAAALAHALEHEEGVHHHHEDDGTIHYDDSAESLEHVQEPSSASQPAGLGFPRLTLPSAAAVSEPGPYLAQPVPEPFLDGPHRPPAFAPGHAAGGMQHA